MRTWHPVSISWNDGGGDSGGGLGGESISDVVYRDPMNSIREIMEPDQFHTRDKAANYRRIIILRDPPRARKIIMWI